MIMKALSIQQPYAWLIANGYKPIENRDWPTKFRGVFLIHAGKKLDKEALYYLKAEYPHIPWPDQFELGGFVGAGYITDCTTYHPSPWFYGKFGFVIENAYPINFKPYKGQLGFFNVDSES